MWCMNTDKLNVYDPQKVIYVSLLEFEHFFRRQFEDAFRLKVGDRIESNIIHGHKSSRKNEPTNMHVHVSNIMSVVVGSDDVYGAVLVTTFTIIATYVIKCLHEIVCTLHTEHNLRWSSAFHMHIYCCFLLYIFQHRQEQIALAFSLLK